jgi:hypothetical protein
LALARFNQKSTASWNGSRPREFSPQVQTKNFREAAVCPSWDRAIPQVMQQHGGRNRYPVIDPSTPVADQAAPDETAPRRTSLQVYPLPALVPLAPDPRPK